MCYATNDKCRLWNHGFVEAVLKRPTWGQGRHTCYQKGWDDAIASATQRGSEARYKALQAKMRGL